MHELGLAEDVLKKIKEEAKNRGLSKVAYAKVAIGETLISDQAEFEEIFSVISAGSVVEEAKLNLEILPLKAVCASCGAEFSSGALRINCDKCGSVRVQITSGRELVVRDIK